MFEEEARLIERIKRENEEFNRLCLEHQALETKLEEYAKLKYLSPEEEYEKKRLQKMKLAGKDRMAGILRMYKNKECPLKN